MRPLVEPVQVAESDSARAVAAGVPDWAVEVPSLIGRSGGAVSRRHLEEKGYSNRQLKQMVHGRHPLLEIRGDDLVLTKLGGKVVALALTAGMTG